MTAVSGIAQNPRTASRKGLKAERTNMRQFPLVTKLLRSGRVRARHPLLSMNGSHPMIAPLEYFLSLEGAAGFPERLTELLDRPVPIETTNARFKEWTSICAELGATSIVGQVLGLLITGFEVRSPQRQGEKTCDIAALDSTGQTLFFEVKRNQKEDSQELPAALAAALQQLEGSFSCTATLPDRNYDCSDLDELMDSIQNHVDQFVRCKREDLLPGETTPESYADHRVEVIFHKRESDSAEGHYFEPLAVEDLCAHLLGLEAADENVKPKIPMVKQAIQKGANYLMYRATAWGPLDDVVEECFVDLDRRPSGSWASDDERLGSLAGVIIFERYDQFAIVENRRSKCSRLALNLKARAS